MIRPSKETILDELKRWSADHDGTTPGKRRFELDTGITERQWLGRYWTRWNDVVSEAGLSPNALTTERHTDADLVGAMADLARSLGHFPTQPEFDFKRRQDPSFPTQTVFKRRLGNRPEMLALLAALAEREGDEALREICRASAEIPGRTPRGSSRLAAVPDTSVGDERVGFVYMVRSGRNYKIGYSKSVSRREYEIGLQLPQRVELVHAFETDDPAGIERYWHGRFADRRLNGEWFALSKEDIAAFKRRRRFM